MDTRSCVVCSSLHGRSTQCGARGGWPPPNRHIAALCNSRMPWQTHVPAVEACSANRSGPRQQSWFSAHNMTGPKDTASTVSGSLASRSPTSKPAWTAFSAGCWPVLARIACGRGECGGRSALLNSRGGHCCCWHAVRIQRLRSHGGVHTSAAAHLGCNVGKLGAGVCRPAWVGFILHQMVGSR